MIYNYSLNLIKKYIVVGNLEVIDKSNGLVFFCGNGDGELVQIEKPTLLVLIKIFLNPEMQLPLAYENNELKIIKGNLTTFINILRKNQKNHKPTFYNKLVNIYNRFHFYIDQFNLPWISKKNISKHYNLNFYELFLDNNMNYSCAFYYKNDSTLEEAQDNKINLIINRLQIESEMNVLDIGCGWGYLSNSIYKNCSSNVTGITLSSEQLKYANDNKISSNINFLLEDYREHQLNRINIYDRIVSVGMFEHAGIHQFDRFFKELYRLLKPNGLALIHTIIRPKKGITNPWIRKYIFPGGYIASLGEIAPFIENNNFYFENIYYHDGINYQKTLKAWQDNFNINISKTDLNEKMKRRWNFYLSTSQNVFDKDSLNYKVVQILIRKPI